MLFTSSISFNSMLYCYHVVTLQDALEKKYILYFLLSQFFTEIKGLLYVKANASPRVFSEFHFSIFILVYLF